MSLLTIIQSAAIRCGLTSVAPTVAVSSTDLNVLQMVQLANEEGQELGSKYGWQALTNEASFVSQGVQLQGTIQSLTGPDFNFILNETMWDRTTRRPIFGPKSSQEWQQLMAQLMQGPFMQWRLRGNQLLFLPNPPTAGDSIYFEWCTKYWCTSTGGSSPTQLQFQADTDIGILDERLITLGVIWRFREAKGLSYAKEQEKYDNAVTDALGRDAAKPRLNLAGGSADIYPGVLVPSGSWPISGEPG